MTVITILTRLLGILEVLSLTSHNIDLCARKLLERHVSASLVIEDLP